MLILVAHNGRTLELDVQAGTRVEAIQAALTSLSGLTMQDQILIYNGVRLEASKTLSQYGLPQQLSASTLDESGVPVFLYSRSWLRPDSPTQHQEGLPDIRIEEPMEPAGIPACPHPLDDSSLHHALRALPQREKAFKYHLAVAQAIWNASHERTRHSKRLLSEQEVQSMAIDSARANVEVHYKYIHKLFAAFMNMYTPLQKAQREVLLNFDRDMQTLSTTELHPAAVHDQRKYLADLVPKARLQEWADNCRRSREHFAAKVAELEKTFTDLQTDVEGLLVKAPGVDLDDMGQQMELVDAKICTEASILQRLQSDFNQIKRKVEDTVRQLAGSHASLLQPDDYIMSLQSICDAHEQDLLAIRACDSEVHAYLVKCVESKCQMTREVRQQLVHISAQQSRIRDIRHKLAVFQEVANKQGETFAELCLVGRIPAAYHACLAEVVRRRAFQELYASQAAQLAERMAGLREREAKRHEAFRAYVDPFISSELQSQLGLLLPPPLCEVNIPRSPEGSLAEVTIEDLQGRRTQTRLSPTVASVFEQWLPKDQPTMKDVQERSLPSREPITQHEDLQMQNARLRADLAAFKAAAHLQAAKAELPLGWPTMKGSEMLTSPGATAQKSSSSAESDAREQQAAIQPSTSTRDVSTELQEKLFIEALASKDAVIEKLQAKVASQSFQLESYTQRILSLEKALQDEAQRQVFASKSDDREVHPIHSAGSSSYGSTSTSLPATLLHGKFVQVSLPPTSYDVGLQTGDYSAGVDADQRGRDAADPLPLPGADQHTIPDSDPGSLSVREQATSGDFAVRIDRISEDSEGTRTSKQNNQSVTPGTPALQPVELQEGMTASIDRIVSSLIDDATNGAVAMETSGSMDRSECMADLDCEASSESSGDSFRSVSDKALDDTDGDPH